MNLSNGLIVKSCICATGAVWWLQVNYFAHDCTISCLWEWYGCGLSLFISRFLTQSRQCRTMRKRWTPYYIILNVTQCQKPLNLKLNEMEWIYLTSALEWCVKHTSIHIQCTACSVAMHSHQQSQQQQMFTKFGVLQCHHGTPVLPETKWIEKLKSTRPNKQPHTALKCEANAVQRVNTSAQRS